MNVQLPIESQFVKRLPDALNAEIVLGTIATLKEAASWLAYTYLYVRMARSPAQYGVPTAELESDKTLLVRRAWAAQIGSGRRVWRWGARG